MIDIPGIYVGRFKDDPNQNTMLMQIGDTPTYTDDNWANVESTGTIWRYDSKTGEWVDTGLEEVLVEEVTGTKEVIAEGTVPWNLQGLSVYGKSTQQTTTGAQLIPFEIGQEIISTSGLIKCIAKNDGFHIDIKTSVIPHSSHDIYFVGNDNSISETGYSEYENLPAGDYYGAISNPTYTLYVVVWRDGKNMILFQSPAQKFSVQEGDKFRIFIRPGKFSTSGVVQAIISKQNEDTVWEPYTGGQASPSPDYPQEIVTAGASGKIDITVSDGVGQSQSLAISTPNGLPGIPVNSGGNFTDASGQQWVCDEIDFARGVYVQKVAQLEFDGSADEDIVLKSDGVQASSVFVLQVDSAIFVPNDVNGISNQFIGQTILTSSTEIQNGHMWTRSVYFGNAVAVRADEFGSVEEFRQHLSTHPLQILVNAATPIETPLSAEELTAYAALRSYDGTTIIETDEDISGMSAKVVTDVIGKNAWFDPYSELALYYKALAGFASLDDLPMPHSRESSLVRKLLDSSYELGFSVNENSSRNERYLWDLINGTSTMLTNVPKSDTEKFLHVMIGGTVEEYPVVDTELDYWMDKCAH